MKIEIYEFLATQWILFSLTRIEMQVTGQNMGENEQNYLKIHDREFFTC